MEPVFVQALISQLAVKPFDERILCGVAGSILFSQGGLDRLLAAVHGLPVIKRGV